MIYRAYILYTSSHEAMTLLILNRGEHHTAVVRSKTSAAATTTTFSLLESHERTNTI